MYQCVPIVAADLRQRAHRLRESAAVPKAELRRKHVMMRQIARELERQADRIEIEPLSAAAPTAPRGG